MIEQRPDNLSPSAAPAQLPAHCSSLAEECLQRETRYLVSPVGAYRPLDILKALVFTDLEQDKGMDHNRLNAVVHKQMLETVSRSADQTESLLNRILSPISNSFNYLENRKNFNKVLQSLQDRGMVVEVESSQVIITHAPLVLAGRAMGPSSVLITDRKLFITPLGARLYDLVQSTSQQPGEHGKVG